MLRWLNGGANGYDVIAFPLGSAAAAVVTLGVCGDDADVQTALFAA